MSVLPAFGIERQETQEFQDNLYHVTSLMTLGYMELSLKNKTKNALETIFILNLSVLPAWSIPPHKVLEHTANGDQDRTRTAHNPVSHFPGIDKSIACSLADTFHLLLQ